MGLITEQGGVRYEYTRKTCVQVEKISNARVIEMFTTAQFSNDKNSLIFESDKPDDFDLLFPVRLTKVSFLPEVCRPDNLIVTSTPTANFEHLWHTFNDYYAFFCRYKRQ